MQSRQLLGSQIKGFYSNCSELLTLLSLPGEEIVNLTISSPGRLSKNATLTYNVSVEAQLIFRCVAPEDISGFHPQTCSTIWRVLDEIHKDIFVISRTATSKMRDRISDGKPTTWYRVAAKAAYTRWHKQSSDEDIPN